MLDLLIYTAVGTEWKILLKVFVFLRHLSLGVSICFQYSDSSAVCPGFIAVRAGVMEHGCIHTDIMN